MRKKVWGPVLVGLVGLLGLVGCRSEKGGEIPINHPPTISAATFFPSPPRSGQTLVVEPSAADPDGDTIQFRYEWVINGKNMTNPGRELPPLFFKKGDHISLRITPSDNQMEGAVFETPVIVVENTPPEIVSIELLPQPVHPGEEVRAVVEGRDADGDSIRYDYQWKKNGDALFSANQDQLPGGGLRKNDRITVVVTPHDGGLPGRAIESLPAVIINRGPEIISSPPSQFTGKMYSYPVLARDSDGDPLTFSLKEPLPGMTIHPETGLFEWRIPEEMKGVRKIVLNVHDPDGGRFTQEFHLDIDLLRNVVE